MLPRNCNPDPRKDGDDVSVIFATVAPYRRGKAARDRESQETCQDLRFMQYLRGKVWVPWTMKISLDPSFLLEG